MKDEACDVYIVLARAFIVLFRLIPTNMCIIYKLLGLEEGHEVAENKVEELYGHKMMDYPGPHPDPRDNPPPPPPPTDEENIMENSVN
ncbi:hypothetical protein HID58_022196 [Brassica napus]|uniref:Uncharacterized protein n=1 Tax=Brassica napus TaxID=3708 RepID=A0ABQ8D038_BRANA|nr:hypothetical protein HID58_022196 [Brassica napus]